jgi:3-dehydroquinate dehydratase/shikimate dehydrogenase
MNNGKICVSVCAETADDFIAKIKQAGECADLIELRFDCLKIDEFDLAIQKLNEKTFSIPFLATFRPKSDLAISGWPGGGKLNSDINENSREETFYRKEGWKKISNLQNIKMVDFETDILLEFLSSDPAEKMVVFDPKTDNQLKSKEIIISEHFFEKIPKNPEETFDGMDAEEKGGLKIKTIKIATQINEITESISLWKLFDRARVRSVGVIPIGMGEAGKWTRILGLAYGSPITYASLEEGNETAPGQISARDLKEVYRVKELNNETEIYGIIGNPVSHSLSPYMHNAAFNHHQLNAVYIPFKVSDLDKFISRMVREETREIDWNLKGFSVTIPHKETIIKHLDHIDEDAKAIGAVNTVRIVDGKLHGYNTDAKGFIEPLLNSYGNLKNVKVAVIGNGGAARACIYALKKEEANITIFARNPQKAEKLANEFNVDLKELNIPNSELSTQHPALSTQHILINTTPLGTVGKLENETPLKSERLKNLHLVYDLVYNPFETKLIREAKKVDVPTIGGLAMLVAQGMEQFEIWTGGKAPMQMMSRPVLKKLK